MIEKQKSRLNYQNIFLPWVLPLLIAVYILYLGWNDTVASISRIDPEYLNLLNGLNVSVFRFDNIGYTDLPGTPFLILTGIFIRIIHLFVGEGSIIDDVLTRPDSYLQSSSYLLLLLTTGILIWGGRKIMLASKDVFAMFLLQSTFVLTSVNLSLQTRYNADRILPLLAFIFSVYALLFVYKSISERKFALISGIIMGVGFITKFNFIVLGIIPIFLLKNYRTILLYIIGGFFAAILSFLPIINKFQNVWHFISRLILFNGKYGEGEKGLFNFQQLIETIRELPVVNRSLVVILTVSFITFFVFLIFKRKKKNTKEFLFLSGYILSVILLVVMASKHFKNYYLAPVLGLSGIALFINWTLISEIFKKRKESIILLFGLLPLIIIISTTLEVQLHRSRMNAHIKNRLKTLEFAKNNLDPDAYWFLTPAWKAGLFPQNGLMWGISYVAGRNDFAPYYLKHFPRILSFEGRNKPISHFRTKDADIKEVFQEKNTIYMFSSIGRNTREMIDELNQQAANVNCHLNFDTIYSNQQNNDHLIEVKIKQDTTNFELNVHSYFNDFETESVQWSKSQLSNEKYYSGERACKLNHLNRNSPVFQVELNPEQNGSLMEIHVKNKFWSEYPLTKTRLNLEIFNTESDKLWHSVAFSAYPAIEGKWNDFEYTFYVPASLQNARKIRLFFENRLKKSVYFDDILVDLYFKANPE